MRLHITSNFGVDQEFVVSDDQLVGNNLEVHLLLRNDDVPFKVGDWVRYTPTSGRKLQIAEGSYGRVARLGATCVATCVVEFHSVFYVSYCDLTKVE